MPPPILKATAQSALIAALSNILAQAITAHNTSSPLTINWIPVLQFFLFAIVSTPPNFLWQEFLESTFPAYHLAPSTAAVLSASKGNEKELDDEAREGKLVERKLNKGNTVAKTVLDQSLGAVVNTLMFGCFMHGVKMAMRDAQVVGVSGILGGVKWERVDWGQVWERASGEFWGVLTAGWRFWPVVSCVNYVFLTSVEARNLVGSLAGLGWGVYMSLVTGS